MVGLFSVGNLPWPLAPLRVGMYLEDGDAGRGTDERVAGLQQGSGLEKLSFRPLAYLQLREAQER